MKVQGTQSQQNTFILWVVFLFAVCFCEQVEHFILIFGDFCNEAI